MYVNYKRLKPNLLDPLIESKIKKTLMPVKDDYWAPVRSSGTSFVQNIVKKNIGLIILIIIIILFLIYRYRIIKKEREMKELEEATTTSKNTTILNSITNPEMKQYADILLAMYNQQKENATEPRFKYKKSDHSTKAKNIYPNFSYPIYPYSKGKLISSERK